MSKLDYNIIYAKDSKVLPEHIKGIIFDMDGVLVDSEPAMFKSAIAALKRFGVEAKPEDFIPYVGTGERSFLGNVSIKYGVEYTDKMKDYAYEIYCNIVDDEIILFENIYEVLKTLKDRGHKIAVASGADKVKVDANIKASRIPRDIFDCIITGSDITKNKPNPEIFLKAAEGLGIDPQNCIVVEDAISGIKGAKAGGMKCLAISSSFDNETLFNAGADCVGKHIAALLSINS